MLTQLIRLGLTEKEAKVYLAALELGSQTAQEIAKKAGVNRATTYVILQALIRKGLVSMFSAGKKTSFAAEAPEHLDHLLRKQEEDIFEQRRDLEKIIPELRAVHQRAPGKPLVRFFDGDEGVRLMLSGMWRQLQGPAVLKSFLVFDDQGIETSRLMEPSSEVTVQMLYTHEQGPQSLDEPKKQVEARYLNPKDYPFEASILLIPSRHQVAVISRRHRVSGMVLENPEMTRTLESVFDALWRSLPRD